MATNADKCRFFMPSLEVDGFLIRQQIGEDATAVHFELQLEPGRHELRGLLLDADQRPICSAYYAGVERLTVD